MFTPIVDEIRKEHNKELIERGKAKEAIKLIVMKFANFEDVIDRISAEPVFTIEEVKRWLKRRVADFIVAPGRGQIKIDFDHMFRHLDDELQKEEGR